MMFNGIMTGWIDQYIVFYPESCTSSYSPKRGDQVRYHAIECMPNEHFNNGVRMRAFRVIPFNDVIRQKMVKVDETVREHRKILEELLEDKNGIEVDKDVTVMSKKIGEIKTVMITVKNFSSKVVHLTSVTTSSKRGSEFMNSVKFLEPELPIELNSEDGVQLVFEVTLNSVGKSKELVTLHFNGDEFQIGTYINCENREKGLNMLLPESGNSYQRNAFLASHFESGSVIPGRKAVSKTNRTRYFGKKRLGEYAIPNSLWREALAAEQNELLDKFPTLGEPLMFGNYEKKFNALLYLEEISMNEQMKQYDMKGVVFQRQGGCLALEVPGLAEKRPSIMLGDSVHARQSLSRVFESTKFDI